LSGWVEAFPSASATASVVIKVILEQIIPRYGIVENTDSDQGSHFPSSVLQGFMGALGIKWEFHTPWHPSSSGKVERMNQTLKKHPSKLVLETKFPWTKCLPLALLRIRTASRKDVGVSPYEMLFGLPYLGRNGEIPIFETKDIFLKNYMPGLSSSLESLRVRGLLAQTPPLEFPVHSFHAGDRVLIRTWKESKLRPEWEGPFQVLLSTETAVRAAEKGWTHYTRVKAATDPSAWEVVPTDDLLKVKIKKKNLVTDSEQDKSLQL